MRFSSLLAQEGADVKTESVYILINIFNMRLKHFGEIHGVDNLAQGICLRKKEFFALIPDLGRYSSYSI